LNGVNRGQVFVVTTWDDGDKFTWKLTSLLEKYRIKATFFVPIKPTKYGRIADEEVRELSKAYDVGGHGITHSDLTKLPIQVARKEIKQCKQVLEQLCETTVQTFSYPGGKLSKELKVAVKDAGFIAARTTKPYNIKETRDPFAIPVSIQAHRQNISRNLFHLAKIDANLIHHLFKEREKWDKLAEKLFDICLEKGGVFHCWGHTWEIEKEDGWKALENIFSHISYRKNVSYLDMRDYAFKVYNDTERVRD